MKKSFSGRARLLMLSVIAGLSIQGCGYLQMITRQRVLESRIKAAPSLSLIKELIPDRCITVYGQIRSMRPHTSPVAIVAFSFESGKQEIVDFIQTESDGYYTLLLPEGLYYLYAFQDVDNNGTFTTNECVGMYNNELKLSDSCNFTRITGGIDILIAPRPFIAHLEPFQLHLPRHINASPLPSGTLRSLDDPLFSTEVARKGIFSPTDFLRIAPMYFYALHHWSDTKIPIVFVHGYGGTPQEFSYIVEHIDTAKFQPWFFYYPSGQQLNRSADLFYEIFLSGTIIRYPRKRLVIYAHSMGGLVARYALNKYKSGQRTVEQIDYISAGTPYGGNPEAEIGIKKMPVVIPSWLNISAHSPFIENLHSTTLSSDIRFFLFFSFKNCSPIISRSSDGTISLESQLHATAQQMAIMVRGFDATHTGILTCHEMVDCLNEILNDFSAFASPP